MGESITKLLSTIEPYAALAGTGMGLYNTAAGMMQGNVYGGRQRAAINDYRRALEAARTPPTRADILAYMAPVSDFQRASLRRSILADLIGSTGDPVYASRLADEIMAKYETGLFKEARDALIAARTGAVSGQAGLFSALSGAPRPSIGDPFAALQQFQMMRMIRKALNPPNPSPGQADLPGTRDLRNIYMGGTSPDWPGTFGAPSGMPEPYTGGGVNITPQPFNPFPPNEPNESVP